MNKLLELRTDLATALGALGITTYTHVPGRLDLPGAFVMAGSPYIEQGQTFGERIVRFQVVIATQTGDNLSETSALDELILSAQAALEEDGWVVESIEQPYASDFNNAKALVTILNVSAPETFN
ncbi:hypothetical protein [Microbacterium oleivorans]|uniref:DUF3168 domain-containing protein n=1 Tax=Microbacterium oleivorans TaxID=273677 RepID=A0A4R5YGZ8_9MICO|nr:hypothetical protein [Microbacterium oleivorans]TDL43599.1 hypothetical protein E2R54_10320 [Microbacterium oleivorans]